MLRSTPPSEPAGVICNVVGGFDVSSGAFAGSAAGSGFGGSGFAASGRGADVGVVRRPLEPLGVGACRTGSSVGGVAGGSASIGSTDRGGGGGMSSAGASGDALA